jgi:hypothetical protein
MVENSAVRMRGFPCYGRGLRWGWLAGMSGVDCLICSSICAVKQHPDEVDIGKNGRGERIRTSDPLVPNQIQPVAETY